jgi:hypothetical protein
LAECDLPSRDLLAVATSNVLEAVTHPCSFFFTMSVVSALG